MLSKSLQWSACYSDWLTRLSSQCVQTDQAADSFHFFLLISRLSTTKNVCKLLQGLTDAADLTWHMTINVYITTHMRTSIYTAKLFSSRNTQVYSSPVI